MFRKILLLPLTILFVSCASAPPKQDYELDVIVPDSWRNASSTDVDIDSSWWMEFNDSQLNDIIGEAFSKNYSLSIAAANLQAAAALAKIAGAPLYPQANLAFNGSRNKQKITLRGFPGCVIKPHGEFILPENDVYIYSEGLNPEPTNALIHSKSDSCTGCKLHHECDGPSLKYTGLFGWDEFIPIKNKLTV